MSRLSREQQQALMGAWYDIVGSVPGPWVDIVGRHGGHGHHFRHGRHRRFRGWGGYDGGGDFGDFGASGDFMPYDEGDDDQLMAPPVPVPIPAPVVAPVAAPVAVPVSGYGNGNGYQIPPRNALVEAPSPDRAGREVLPMSTGVAILPTQSAQITARPQRVAFRPERVFISAAGTSGGAADWVVNDIKIGNRSQFSQSGDVPGDMFATNAIDGFVSFETAQTAMDVVMVVTYIGLNESGVPFFASIVGTAAI